MSNFFRNCRIYSVTNNYAFPDFEQLETALKNFTFRPCAASEMASTGWYPPAPGGKLLHHPVGNGFMLQHRHECKIIPPDYLRKMTNERIAKLEQDQARHLKRVEKNALKDDVLHSLIPRAFTKTSVTNLWVDIDNERIWIDTTASKSAENVLALLRKTLGSLPVVPLTMENPVELTLTEWLKAGAAPQRFLFGESAEMKGVLADGGVVRCKKIELDSDEVKTHLEAGRCATKLEMSFDERMDFIITDDVGLLRLKFADELHEANSDLEEEMSRYDADMLLMTSELTVLLKSLVTALGGEFK
ncbi:recombination-associated protein RdgC [Escherichia coli]|uniref:recombination-associated protein RdgC n=1 Tax=Escherichia coli TaxID=562 RepID=UPI0017EC1E94|nr:recombination-associated protein RdgC [Escherichia coli]EKI3096594.1 recombination-associated protein RdgC [Escherichia coli]MBB9841093.1 recombination-associated protein RdgC [Escherichia coli]MBS9328519.1 recombination-associated protein RdgC [Escherichia coli]